VIRSPPEGVTCLTVHKDRGSEWGNILLINESHCFGQYRRNWLYSRKAG